MSRHAIDFLVRATADAPIRELRLVVELDATPAGAAEVAARVRRILTPCIPGVLHVRDFPLSPEPQGEVQ